MGRRTISKKNRKFGVWQRRQTNKAGLPYSKASIKERALAAFHKEHVWVGSYPDARWVSIDEEE